jgi:GntR family transcriptional regulator
VLYSGFKDAAPPCEPIKEELRRMIISYAIEKDEPLPAVGELASRHAVSPNRVAQVYRDLEREGFVYYIEGSGYFVADKTSVDEHRREALFREFDHLVIQLSSLSVAADELARRVNKVAEGERELDRSK